MKESNKSTEERKGVVAVIKNEDRFLVIRRSRFVRAPRKLCFPGGGVEGSESNTEALKREIAEELNVVAEPLKHIWSVETASGVHLTWWTTNIGAQRVKVCPAEVEAFHWLRIDEMLSKKDLLETNRCFLQAVQKGEIEF